MRSDLPVPHFRSVSFSGGKGVRNRKMSRYRKGDRGFSEKLLELKKAKRRMITGIKAEEDDNGN